MSLGALAIVAAVLAFMAFRLFPAIFMPVVAGFAEFGVAGIGLLTGGAALGLAVSLSSGRRRGFWGLAHFGSYPPLWLAVVAAVFGFIGLELLTGSFPHNTEDEFLADCLLIGAFAVMGVFAGAEIAGRVFDLKSTPHHASTESSDEHAGITDLEAWINRADHPVELPSQSFGDHVQIARRIAFRILDAKSDLPTFGVFGPKGSGKTTTGKLVKYFLARPTESVRPRTYLFPESSSYTHVRIDNSPSPKRVAFVQLSAWPYNDTAAFIKGVLGAMVKELHGHVDAYELVGLPSAYASLITSADKRGEAIARVVMSPTDKPQRIIERLDELLGAIDTRMVVWIDDLERFELSGPAGATNSKAPRTVSEPVQALFAEVRKRKNMSFVIASEHLDSTPDLIKLFTFVEIMPTIDFVDGARLLEKAIAEEYRVKGHLLRPAELIQNEDIVPYLTRTTLEDLAIVMGTPRALKTCMTRARAAWKMLDGEVLFEDLILLHALRVSGLEHFEARLGDHLTRNGLEEASQMQALAAQVGLQGSESSGAGAINSRPRAIDRLWQLCDPGSNRVKVDGWYPQSFLGADGPRYWRRVLNEHPSEPNDQALLRAVRDVIDASEGDRLERAHNLAQWLVSEREQCHRVGNFGKVLAPVIPHLVLAATQRWEPGSREWDKLLMWSFRSFEVVESEFIAGVCAVFEDDPVRAMQIVQAILAKRPLNVGPTDESKWGVLNAIAGMFADETRAEVFTEKHILTAAYRYRLFLPMCFRSLVDRTPSENVRRQRFLDRCVRCAEADREVAVQLAAALRQPGTLYNPSTSDHDVEGTEQYAREVLGHKFDDAARAVARQVAMPLAEDDLSSAEEFVHVARRVTGADALSSDFPSDTRG